MTQYVRASMTPEFFLLTPTLLQLSLEISKEASHVQIKSMYTRHCVYVLSCSGLSDSLQHFGL